VRQPPRDAEALIVRPVQFPDESTPRPRATRGTGPALRIGARLYVKLRERPDLWVQATITAVRHSTVEVERDE
jgi:hypothetical protein